MMDTNTLTDLTIMLQTARKFTTHEGCQNIDLFFHWYDNGLSYDTIKKYFPLVAESFDTYVEEMNKQYTEWQAVEDALNAD